MEKLLTEKLLKDCKINNVKVHLLDLRKNIKDKDTIIADAYKTNIVTFFYGTLAKEQD